MDWTDNSNAICYCLDNPSAEDCDKVTKAGLKPKYPCASLKASFGGKYRWDHNGDREPWRLGGNSGTTVCADINNDGFIDLLTTEIVHADVGSSSDPSEIMVNLAEPEVRFERPGNEVTGLLRVDATDYWDHGDMSGAVFDFDNDGWQDVYIGASDYPGNKGLLFRQKSPLVFERLEFADYFEHARAHGVAVADFDQDGDLDMVVGHSHMRCDGAMGADCYPTQQVRLFLNQMGPGSNWLQLHLTGASGANRAAIGARVEVKAGGVLQTQLVDGGHGQAGIQRDLVLHFGLGAACEAEVTVRWPDAAWTAQSFKVAAYRRYEVAQGQAPGP
jgi:hypothetical protein